MGARARVTGASVTVEGDEVALPDPLELATGVDPLLPGPGSALWPALTRLAGLALLRTTPREGLDPRSLLAALLGWLPARGRLRVPGEEDTGIDLAALIADWPPLPLAGLVTDPVETVRSWLGDVLAGSGGADRSVAAIALLRELFARGGPERIRQVAVAGDGTHERPWRLPLDDSGPELLIWLDPDGPGLDGLGEVLDALVPADLTAALDGSAPLPGVERLTAVLSGAARFDSDLAELLDERPDSAADLWALLNHAAGSDGLLPVSAQVLPGTTHPTVVLPRGHLCAPETFELSDHLPGADPTRTVYVSSDLPGIRPWPGQPGRPGHTCSICGHPAWRPSRSVSAGWRRPARGTYCFRRPRRQRSVCARPLPSSDAWPARRSCSWRTRWPPGRRSRSGPRGASRSSSRWAGHCPTPPGPGLSTDWNSRAYTMPSGCCSPWWACCPRAAPPTARRWRNWWRPGRP